MAPSCPEEVDVFTVPHSRMKELVCKYLDMLTATNFANVGHLTKLLENLIKTFQEFIAHEQIENQFIMKKLKNKLRSLSIQNTAVCNCHKDNRLTDMLKFLQDGYKCTKKSELDRHNYGLQLRQALEDFTEDFLPHMEEEEEVFQPLLMQHFSFEELKQIKATVIQQHFKAEPEEVPEKCVADVKSCKPEKDVQEPVTKVTDLGFENLPDEILLKVFCHLNPLELSRCAQVSRRWNSLAMDGSLWTQLYPVSWAKGDWNAKHGVDEEDRINVEKEMSSKAFDEDADIDETDDWDEEAREIKFQSSMLTFMCKHLLPRVGRTIKHCDLAYSRGLTNGTLYKILSLCPNLEFLDLTQTRVSDLGFKGFKKASCGKMLRHLDLSGCLYITDLTLQRLSAALGQISCHMTKGEGQLVDHVTPMEDHVTEPVNEDNGCEKCKENRKNEDKRGCMKVKTGKNIDVGKNGQEICQATFNVSQCMKERFVEGTKVCCDRKTSCSGDQGNQRARRNPECRCCHGNHKKEEKLSEQQHDKGELSQPNLTDEIQLNNGNKESQDRSWIKQGHSDKGESSRTSDNGISTELEGIMKSCTKTHQALPLMQEVKQISTKVDHQPDRDSCKQVVVETYTQQSNQLNIYSAEEIINQNTPGQTFLPGYIFQAWNMEKVTDTVTPNISQHPNESSVTSSVQACKTVPGNEGPEVLSRSLEFLSLSGCYQVTDTGLKCEHCRCRSASIFVPSDQDLQCTVRFLALDLKPHQIEWVVRHMGHSLDVHKIYYRSTSDIIERTQVAKILLLQDTGRLDEFANQSLEDIQLSDLAEESTPEDVPMEELFIASEEMDEDIYDSLDPTETGQRAKKTNSAVTRKIWTTEEEEIRQLFNKNFEERKRPTPAQCLKAIRKRKNKGCVIQLRKKDVLKKRSIG